jgi:hypothetical protein
MMRGGRPIHTHCRRRSISTARPAPSDSHRRVAAGPQKGKGAGLHVNLTRSGGVHDKGGPAYPYTQHVVESRRSRFAARCDIYRLEKMLWCMYVCVCDRVVGHFYGLPRPGE